MDTNKFYIFNFLTNPTKIVKQRKLDDLELFNLTKNLVFQK
jgi:hypothetical protein